MPQVASMGASVAVADFDRDGWQDFYVTNSGEGSLNRLYRNNGDGTFADVAAAVGLADVNQAGTGVSMGAVWGDFDNDGDEDLFLYKYGRPELFRNDGGRAFVRVSEQAGLPPLGQCQFGDLVGLRLRRTPRPAPGGLLARATRSLAPADHAHHARELRVRRERRQEVRVPQSRRRHVRGDVGRAGDSVAALDAGGGCGGSVGLGLSGPVPRQRLRHLRALRESGRQEVRRGRTRERRRPDAEERDERVVR